MTNFNQPPRKGKAMEAKWQRTEIHFKTSKAQRLKAKLRNFCTRLFNQTEKTYYVGNSANDSRIPRVYEKR
ncbi:hypothetical protein [Kingella bonacorsii]|uniref:Transposase putative helix-turn-helix domain-containing protein n=1 Tax=Kingella bonacorsii TaxID=2796361 RepID=A0ABS1BVU2_9NEIS|nr:hypothetical protein [Kingella bonacorsii]MBK0396985.1 hypothetical protein [Kingella bonacorsii]